MNIKTTTVGIVLGATLVMPFTTSALSVGDLQAQIKELLAKVASLQVQIQATETTQVQPINSSAGLSLPTQHRVCALLVRNLSQGTAGDDVRGLQEFLSSEGHLQARASGYFGPLTAQAVAKWQAAEGVSAVGSFGPLSRERIKMRCFPDGGGNEYGFRVTPQAGSAPLTVTAYANVGGFSLYRYAIDFGDGSTREHIACSAPADACERPGSVTHIYAQDGTYTVMLYRTHVGGCGANADPRCLGAPAEEKVIAKASVRVGSSPVACTKEYRPVCGEKQVVCITTPCNPIQQTYSNTCMMKADGASFVHEGQCRDTAVNKPPVIASLSGPTTLPVNVSGTWTIQANDPENTSLHYSITWGDEYVNVPVYASSAMRESFVQTSTFSHSYAVAGTYTVGVVVTDARGAQAKTSTTVRVGNEPVACTLQYDPVCARPTGCVNTCAPGMYCTMMCRLHNPVTYGNTCQMNAASAEFLYSGACNASN